MPAKQACREDLTGEPKYRGLQSRGCMAGPSEGGVWLDNAKSDQEYRVLQQQEDRRTCGLDDEGVEMLLLA